MKFYVRGAGPAVVFLHGLPTSGRLWDYVVPVLQTKFTCIVVDLPGAGESPPLAGAFEGGDNHDLDRYAQELEALRERLGISCWHVVGHDAGSTIAVHYAAEFSERVDKLVLCSPPIFPEHKIPSLFNFLRTPVVGDLLAPLATVLLWRVGMPKSIGRHDQRIRHIIKAFSRPYSGYKGARRFLRLLRWGDPQEVLGRTAALLPKIAAPTLILHGNKDGAIPISFATRAAAIIPGAELHLMKCGHFLPLSCPEVVCERLLAFLESDKGSKEGLRFLDHAIFSQAPNEGGRVAQEEVSAG
jgi:pimeloyl-ACP methyl ester carboxylesterase